MRTIILSAVFSALPTVAAAQYCRGLEAMVNILDGRYQEQPIAYIPTVTGDGDPLDFFIFDTPDGAVGYGDRSSRDTWSLLRVFENSHGRPIGCVDASGTNFEIISDPDFSIPATMTEASTFSQGHYVSNAWGYVSGQAVFSVETNVDGAVRLVMLSPDPDVTLRESLLAYGGSLTWSDTVLARPNPESDEVKMSESDDIASLGQDNHPAAQSLPQGMLDIPKLQQQ